MATPEQATTGTIELTPAQQSATQEIGAQAIDTMALHYGGLPFHHQGHALFVRKGTGLMTEAVGLSADARRVAEVAAAAHDIVRLKARGVMEAESAAWLDRKLHAYGFSERAIRAGRLAILGTEPVMQHGVPVGQMATSLEYHSKEEGEIALSVASADLGGEMFRPLGPYRGNQLYKELQGVYGPDKEPPFDGFLAFVEGQVALKQAYRFPHPQGEAVLGALRGEVIDYHVWLAEALRAGDIASWNEVEHADLDFARRHGETMSVALHP